MDAFQLPKPPRLYAGADSAERQARRRAAFMEAGLALFGTVGYRKTTIRALCKAAGLTDRYFYESFTDQEDLLAAVYGERIQLLQAQVLTALAEVPSSHDWDLSITAALHALFRFAEDPVTARVVWLEILGVSDRIDQQYEDSLRFFVDFLHQLTESQFPQAFPEPHQAHWVARAIVSAVSGSAMSWVLTNYREPRETVIQALQIVFKGLLLQADRLQ